MAKAKKSTSHGKPKKKKTKTAPSTAVVKSAVKAAIRETKSADGWGARYGARYGKRIGRFVGSTAQRYFGNITGLGSYNGLTGGGSGMSGTQAPYVNQKNGETTVIHREFIKDIITSSNAGEFKLEAFRLNPGNVNTFPWLSGIAHNYQQYRINGMVFYYRSMSANALNSTNTALGTVAAATNYNASDGNFTSKYQMENSEFGGSVRQSADLEHPIECARNQTTLNELYVAPGGIYPPGDDRKTYDLGTFQIATVGGQAPSVNVGELWVTYSVTFLKPIAPTPRLPSAPQVPSGPTDTPAYRVSLASWAGQLIVGTETAITSVNSGAYLRPYRWRNPVASLGPTALYPLFINGNGETNELIGNSAPLFMMVNAAGDTLYMVAIKDGQIVAPAFDKFQGSEVTIQMAFQSGVMTGTPASPTVSATYCIASDYYDSTLITVANGYFVYFFRGRLQFPRAGEVPYIKWNSGSITLTTSPFPALIFSFVARPPRGTALDVADTA